MNVRTNANRLTTMDSLLECPLCQNRLSSILYACRNDHIICRECRYQLTVQQKDICAVCGDSYSLIESDTLTEIYQQTSLSCKFKAMGCRLQLPPDVLHHHEKYFCKHRPVLCELSNLKNREGQCLNMVPLSMYKAHVLEAHKLKPERNSIVVGKYINMFILLNEDYRTIDYCVDLHDNEMFLQTLHYNKTTNKLNVKLQHVGDETGQKFVFNLKFYNPNAEHAISLNFVNECGRLGQAEDIQRNFLVSIPAINKLFDKQDRLFYSLRFKKFEGGFKGKASHQECVLM